MKAQYIRLMDALHRACLVIAGVCLVVITLIIPWGVFTRYVLNSASSWPEPLAVLLMICVLVPLGDHLLPREPAHRRRRACRRCSTSAARPSSAG